MDFAGIGRVATNTTLAACAGGLVAMFFVYPRSHKWDTGITINGFLAGLVAITVSVLLGVAVRCDLYRCDRRGDHGARRRLRRVAADRRPDRRGRRARCVRHLRHDQSGFVRHRSVRAPGYRPAPTRRRRSTGCSTEAGPNSSACRSSAVRSSPSWCSSSRLVVMYGVKALGVLRVSEEVELGGIDIHEHGAPAYHPEFAFMGHSAIPSGTAAERVKIPVKGRSPVVGDTATERETISMYLVTAIIKPHRLEDVTTALKELDVNGVTCRRCRASAVNVVTPRCTAARSTRSTSFRRSMVAGRLRRVGRRQDRRRDRRRGPHREDRRRQDLGHRARSGHPDPHRRDRQPTRSEHRPKRQHENRGGPAAPVPLVNSRDRSARRPARPRSRRAGSRRGSPGPARCGCARRPARSGGAAP